MINNFKTYIKPNTNNTKKQTKKSIINAV